MSRQEYVDPNRLGLAGFSVGASYAMVAAADPRISGDVAFMNSLGGYYDAADLLVQIAAGRTLDGVSETPWEVDELAAKVFTNTLLVSAASDAGDAFLTGADSITEARRLFDALPAGFRSDVDAVSPSRYVDDWEQRNRTPDHARSWGRGDTRGRIAASGGSWQLQRERPDIEVSYTETDIFRHVIPDAERDWKSLLTGGWQVCRHMYHIIEVARQ